MSEKAKLSYEQAKAIEAAKDSQQKQPWEHIEHFANHRFYKDLAPLNELDMDTLIRALYIGYEIEVTPEDKVRERYLHLQNNPQGLPWMAVRAEELKMTLDSLNIKIEGVNA
jgi:hypothetical protein